MADYSVKLTLTRDQRRLIDRAAKLAGLKTGPWARSTLLGVAEQPKEGQGQPAAKLQGFYLGALPGLPAPQPRPCRYCGAPDQNGVHVHKPKCPALNPLVRSYEPDKEKP